MHARLLDVLVNRVGSGQGASRNSRAEATRALARRYSDSAVTIDTGTVNPSRLIGLPGTLKTKGCPRPERPWRLATLDGLGTSLRAQRRVSRKDAKRNAKDAKKRGERMNI